MIEKLLRKELEEKSNRREPQRKRAHFVIAGLRYFAYLV